MEKLVLENQEGQVIRSYNWSGRPVQLVRRWDNRRLELLENTEELDAKKIPYFNLGQIDADTLRGPVLVGSLGHLRLMEQAPVVVLADEQRQTTEKNVWYTLLALIGGFALVGSFLLKNVPQMTPKLENELKQRIVKIVKNIRPVEPPKNVVATNISQQAVQRALTNKSQGLKRMGALSALGSLKSGRQRGGLNLGAAQATGGPGMGGTQGSGGIQTSLYASGIVSAPLGAGANMQGAGGYGTKGKGGGQAGYGRLALTGSVGVSAIPLGAEASVAQGLNRDQIAAVIARNQGQVRFCYEQGLQGDSALSGRVSVAFTIGGNGLVKTASIAQSTLKSQVVEDCILMRLKTWKFPLPEGGVDVRISYPFTLQRAGVKL